MIKSSEGTTQPDLWFDLDFQALLLYFCFRFNSMATAWNLREIPIFVFTIVLLESLLLALVNNY